MTKVAINGMGRIGRATLKIIMNNDELQLVAVNDIVPIDDMVYMLRYDSVYGRYEKNVEAAGNNLNIGGREIRYLSEKDPASLPWKDLRVDLVFECSGLFTRKEDLEKHLKAGAGKVILSAPAKSDDVATVVGGVNEVDPAARVISTASCTTTCIAPVMEIMSRRFGVKKAMMTTVHAYTSSQGIVDGHNKKLRRGRAAAINLVPTTTGAAKAAIKVLPKLKDKFDGMAIRGPVPAGSISDITIVTGKRTTAEEINNAFIDEANSGRYRKIVGFSDEELVSSDIIKDTRAAIVDGTSTQVVDGDLVKILAWYDNEWGYASQMVKEGVRISALQSKSV
ncbi:MAG: type I glyceraldehyde-3-phosphate dehydrogenase [Bacteroidia bacterium]